MSWPADVADGIRRMHAADVPFVVFGTAGLALLARAELLGAEAEIEALEQRARDDVDLLLSGRAALQPALQVLKREGWTLTSWGQALETLSPAELDGRWYVRATRAEAQLDLTYECPFLDAAEQCRDAVHVDMEGVCWPVCPENAIWRLKLIANEAKAHAFARQYGLRIPKLLT